MNTKKILFLSILYLIISYKARCIGYLSEECHPLISDSLMPIAPRGYVLLSYDGARRALKANADAQACAKIVAIKDSIIFYKEFEVILTNNILYSEREINSGCKSTVKNLKKKLFVRNLQLSGVVVIILGILSQNLNINN